MSTVVINNPDHLIGCVKKRVEAIILEAEEIVRVIETTKPSWWQNFFKEPAGYIDYPNWVVEYVTKNLWAIEDLLTELKEGRITSVTISSRLYARLCKPHTRIICLSHCSEADPLIRQMRAINIAEDYNVHYASN